MFSGEDYGQRTTIPTARQWFDGWVVGRDTFVLATTYCLPRRRLVSYSSVEDEDETEE